MPTDKSYIGVFDSGLGGLTVLEHLYKLMPNEDYIYFGDNARVPYGSKSSDTVNLYSKQAVEFLKSFPLKFIVVACNTASAIAFETIIKTAGNIPVIGMIRPASESAIKLSSNNKIGIIATEATIRSKAYPKELLELNNQLIIAEKACPLFVPLVESDFIEHKATQLIIEEYLHQMKTEDVIILACTHYPFLKNQIQNFLPNVKIIDSGENAANKVLQHLRSNNKLSKNPTGEIRYFTTDYPNNFINTASKYLSFEIGDVQKVSVE